MPIRSRRRTVSALIAAVTTALSLVGLSQPSAQAATSQFAPGQTWNDTSGAALQMHGLGIIKVGSTWYGFGEDKTGETARNTSFQDIPCYSSTDLSHWTLQSTALTGQSSGDLGPEPRRGAPEGHLQRPTGTYVMYMHIDNASYCEAKVGVATSSTPCGPYTYRGSFQPLGHQSRDIGLFQDTDGTAYLLSEDRANGLRIDKLSADYLSVVSAGGSGGSVALFADYEAPAMVKTDGTYYLLGSHLTGWYPNDNVYATATSLTGSWSSFRDFAPAGTNTYNTQTANIIPVAGSAGTTYIYAGDRWTTEQPRRLAAGLAADDDLRHDGRTSAGRTPGPSTPPPGTWSGSSNPRRGSHPLPHQREQLAGDGRQRRFHRERRHGHPVGRPRRHQPAVDTPPGRRERLHRHQRRTAACAWTYRTSSTATGIALDQGTCDGGTNQQWALDPVGSYTSSSDSSYELTNLNSGLVADVSGGSTAQGAQVIQWTTNGQANQTWTLS